MCTINGQHRLEVDGQGLRAPIKAHGKTKWILKAALQRRASFARQREGQTLSLMEGVVRLRGVPLEACLAQVCSGTFEVLLQKLIRKWRQFKTE